MIATIYEHGSFVFFLYSCVSLLLGLFGLSDLRVPEFWKSFLIIAFEVSVGAGVAVLFIDRFNAHRAQENLKQRLVREAGSRSHDVAISAVEWMDRERWLRGEDGLLKGANLRKARLSEARMDGANLMGTELEAADLRNTTLAGANLTLANLFRADLASAFMRTANLQDAEISWANLSHAHLDSANLRNAKLSQSRLLSTNLNEADFEDAFMLDADFGDASVVGTSFKGANLMHAKLKDAFYLKSACLEGATLCFVDLRGVDLSGCNMEGADFQIADLRDATFDGADLRGANLYGARLEGIRYRFEDFVIKGTKHEYPSGPVIETTEQRFPKTDWLGATLPDGTVFVEGMDFSDIHRFVDPREGRFKESLEAVMTIRNRYPRVREYDSKS